MKKFFSLIILIFVVFSTISCGETTVVNSKYKVEFYGTNISSVEVEKGKELIAPKDPEKENYCFMGWYKDKSFNENVSFPLTVDSNLVLYPKFLEPKEAFLEARKRTVGDTVSSFEFDYNILANVKYLALKLEGTTIGNTKYNKDLKTSFLDTHQNSGLLFFDGSQTSFQSDAIYTKVEFDSDGSINDYSINQVNEKRKTEFNVFNKAIFTFNDKDITNLKKAENVGEYEILTTLNFSTIASKIGDYLSNPFVKAALKKVPLNDINATSIVSFANGYISKYKYNISINVKGINFNLNYEMNIKNIDKNTVINTPKVEGVYIDSKDLTTVKNKLDSYIRQYKDLEHSGYDFKMKTGVNFDGSNSIDATVKGSTRRKVGDTNSYFINDVEIDSDFKNGDLYKYADLDDIHIFQTILSNNDAYIIEKKVLKDNAIKINNYKVNDNDLYYMLGVFTSVNHYKFVQDISGNNSTYSITLDNSSIKNILNYINESVNIDPLNKTNQQIKLFGDFNEDSLEINKCKLIVKVSDNLIEDIELVVKGSFDTKFNNSIDFNEYKFAAFELKFSLKTNTNAHNWEPYSSVNDAKKGK